MREFVFTGDTQDGILKFLHDSMSEEEYFKEVTTWASSTFTYGNLIQLSR